MKNELKFSWLVEKKTKVKKIPSGMSNLKDNPVYKFVNVFKGYTIAEKRMIKYRSDSAKEIK